MRKSSAGLMLLPVVGLAAYGLLSRGHVRPRVPHSPGPYIEDMKLVPRSAREVSQGYAGVVRLTLDWMGPKPAGWGQSLSYYWMSEPLINKPTGRGGRPMLAIGAVLVADRNKRQQVIGTRENLQVRNGQFQFGKETWWSPGRYTLDCRYKLDAETKTMGEVRLLAAAALGAGRVNRRSLALLRDGEADATSVSHDSQIKVIRTKVNWLPPVDATFGDCNITAEVKYTGDRAAVRWNPDEDFVVVDAHGKSWTLRELNFGLSASIQYTGKAEEPARATRTLNWWFSTRKLPPGRAVFKSGVGIDEGWLEPIVAVLHTGKERPPSLKPTSLRLIEARAGPASASLKRDGFDTTTTVLFNVAGRLPKQPSWIYDYSQHLVDWRGRDEWVVWKASGEGGDMDMTKPAWMAARQCWQATYSYRAAAFRRGPVLFRAELGLPGEKLVPVECVVKGGG